MAHNRLYGEPDWLKRPTELPGREATGLCPQTSESYEEWRLNNMVAPQDIIIARSIPVRPVASLQGLVDIVDICVGETNMCWRIHKTLLNSDSNFARKAFASSFMEQKEQKLNLPEHDPKAFDVYVKYLYTGTLNLTSYHLDDLLRMYVLGDQLDTPRFLDAVFNLIFSCTNVAAKAYTKDQIIFILENTPLQCPLRNLCLDHVGLGIVSRRYTFQTDAGKGEDKSDSEVLPEEYKAEFLDGVMAALNLQNLDVKEKGLDRLKYPLHHE